MRKYALPVIPVGFTESDSDNIISVWDCSNIAKTCLTIHCLITLSILAGCV